MRLFKKKAELATCDEKLFKKKAELATWDEKLFKKKTRPERLKDRKTKLLFGGLTQQGVSHSRSGHGNTVDQASPQGTEATQLPPVDMNEVGMTWPTESLTTESSSGMFLFYISLLLFTGKGNATTSPSPSRELSPRFGSEEWTERQLGILILYKNGPGYGACGRNRTLRRSHYGAATTAQALWRSH